MAYVGANPTAPTLRQAQCKLRLTKCPEFTEGHLIMYKVYIALCLDGSLYTGITANLKDRYDRHTKGLGSKHTLQRGIDKILYTENFKTRVEAAQRERQIKGWRREKKLNLIKFGRPNL